MSMHKIPLTELEQLGLEKHKLSTDKPSQLSDCFRLGVQHATQSFNDIVIQLCKEKNALQAEIDLLMLEFCPEEMTQYQIENWEQHQVVSTHSKLIITTGDDVSDVVWTEEKLEELQRVVDKIKKEEQSSKQCCEGGPQWGHAWDCPKCPD